MIKKPRFMVKCSIMEHHDIRQSAQMLTPSGTGLEPEDKLAVAIIRQAYYDVQKGTKGQRKDALTYFSSPFFDNHCALLDMRPEDLKL